MKNSFFAVVILAVLVISCSKKEPAPVDTVREIKVEYDTTAIDSFSSGAVSVDIARKIRMSSKQYQDSLKEVIRLQKEEKRIKEELEKENKKKQEEEKKKTEQEKKEKTSAPSPGSSAKKVKIE